MLNMWYIVFLLHGLLVEGATYLECLQLTRSQIRLIFYFIKTIRGLKPDANTVLSIKVNMSIKQTNIFISQSACLLIVPYQGFKTKCIRI